MPVRSTNLIKTSQRARCQGRENNKEEWRRAAGEAGEPSADETTAGELTRRQMGRKPREDGEQQTQFLYLSTSESEESLSSDLEAEGQQERGVGEVGRGNGVKHTQERQKGYRTRVKGSK